MVSESRVRGSFPRKSAPEFVTAKKPGLLWSYIFLLPGQDQIYFPGSPGLNCLGLITWLPRIYNAIPGFPDPGAETQDIKDD